MPEVFPVADVMVPITHEWQELAFALFRHGAPSMDEKTARLKWRVFYDHDSGYSNKSHGYDYGVPLADYINGRDLSSPPPDWDKYRLTGGQTVTGYEDGNSLVVTTLVADNVPTLAWLLERPWLYFVAVYVRNDGHVADFPVAMGERALMPMVTRTGTMRAPLAMFEKLPPNSPPADPYKIE